MTRRDIPVPPRTPRRTAIVRSMSRRLAILITTLAGVALSAGVVLAARPADVPPAAAGPGLTRASEAAGRTVPVVTTGGAPTIDQKGTDEDAQDPSAPDEEVEDAGTHTGDAA